MFVDWMLSPSKEQKSSKMASSEVIKNRSKGNSLRLSTTEDIDIEKVNSAIKGVVVLLSESDRPSLEKKEVSTIRNLHLMLLDATRLCNGITSSTLWHEFVKILLMKLLMKGKDQLASANESRKLRLVVGNQAKLFVKMILKSSSPFVDTTILLHHLQLMSDRTNTHNLSILLDCLLQNICNKEEHDQIVNALMKLTQNSLISSRIHRVCIGLFCSLENKTLFLESAREISVDCPDVVARKIVNWLIIVSSLQNMSTPADKIRQASMKKVVIQEIDGMPSRDIFTALNLTSTYRTEHINNIYSFSILQRWLIVLQKHDTELWNNIVRKIPKPTRAATAIPKFVGQSSFYLASSASSGSSGHSSLSSSISSLHSFLFVENENDKSQDFEDSFSQSIADGSPPQHQSLLISSALENQSSQSSSSLRRPMSVSTMKKNSTDELAIGSRTSLPSLSAGGLTLKSACIRYCGRILNQAERSPRKLEDRRLLEAAAIEAVRILTILCQQDDSLVKKIFPEIKRVHARFLGKSSDVRCLYPADIQFFVEHFDSMIFNTEELVNSYLSTIPVQLHTSSSACFEVLDFCLRNAECLQRFSFLSRFFPNLLKIIAWHPRSFLYEFLELIPLFMMKETTSEVFHSLLDIPCTSVMLELALQGNIDQFLFEKLETSVGDSDGFFSKSHRQISDFFLRCESGGPETIDKLDKIFAAVAPMSNKTRVTCCCQVVPILLQKFFACLIAQSNKNAHRKLFPSLLERVFILFPNASLQNGVRHILSEQVVRICSLNPDFISAYQDEILYVFKEMRTSCSGLDSVLSSLVYCIGEFSIRPGVCSMEQIAKYYEVIETLLYETKTSLFVVNEFPVDAKLLSSLISTVGKLAAFSQDFVPKTVICLSKLAGTEWRMDTCRLNQREFDIVMSRASDIINILRLPTVSPAVLCSTADVAPWHLNKDSSLQLKIQAMSRKEVVGTNGN